MMQRPKTHAFVSLSKLFVGLLTILHLQWTAPCAINTAASRQKKSDPETDTYSCPHRKNKERKCSFTAARMRLGDHCVVEPATQKVIN